MRIKEMLVAFIWDKNSVAHVGLRIVEVIRHSVNTTVNESLSRKMHQYLTPRNNTIGKRLSLRKQGY